MRAKTADQYNQAWQHHIDQLASLALAAGIEYHRYTEVKATLEAWLTEATSNFTTKEMDNG